jgi:ankyrin repeat protein
MLGGELKAPLIWHAPKNQDDLLLHKMHTKLQGHPHDCERLKAAILALTIEQINRLPPESAQLRDMFFTRISRNDVESVIQILESENSLINSRSSLGTSALNWSITTKAHKCTDHLLSAGADINAKDGNGLSAINFALIFNNPNLLNILLALGADPNALDSRGNSLLMIAAFKGLLLQVKYLLKYHAKLDVWNNHHTALTIAVGQGDYDIVNELIMAGAGADCGLDQELIEQAEEQGDLAIVDLLERNLTKVNDSIDAADMVIDEDK